MESKSNKIIFNILIKHIFSYEDFNNYLEKYKYIIINIGANFRMQ
jgi:hypothetical protein